MAQNRPDICFSKWFGNTCNVQTLPMGVPLIVDNFQLPLYLLYNVTNSKLTTDLSAAKLKIKVVVSKKDGKT